MPTVTDELATTRTVSDQHDLLATPPTRTTLLRIPRRRATGLLRILHTLMGVCTRSHFQERPPINPDYPRQETVVDRVVRIDLYLYLRSLSG
jgi:hypothetical protein